MSYYDDNDDRGARRANTNRVLELGSGSEVDLKSSSALFLTSVGCSAREAKRSDSGTSTSVYVGWTGGRPCSSDHKWTT